MFKKFKQYRSRAEMMQAGYSFDDDPKVSYCRDCNTAQEWCNTPQGKRLPLNWGTCQCHFDVCPGKQPRSQNGAPAVANRMQPPAPAPAWPATSPAPAKLSPAQETDAPAPAIVRSDLVRAMDALTSAIHELTQAFARRATGGGTLGGPQ